MVSFIGHDGTTNEDELLRAGKHFLKHCFRGVYSSDEASTILDKMDDLSCVIANNESRNENGEHWIALYKSHDNIHIYDSFGRKGGDVSHHFGEYVRSHPKPEQHLLQTNCGQLSLAWLMTVSDHSIDEVSKLL